MDKVLTLTITVDPCVPEEAFKLYSAACALHPNAEVDMELTNLYDLGGLEGAESPAASTIVTPGGVMEAGAAGAEASVEIPVTPVPAAPAPAPAAVATPAAPAPAPATPSAPGKTYTLDELSVAGSWLVDQGKMDAVMDILSTKYGVQTVTQLREADYPAFAADLRALGANI